MMTESSNLLQSAVAALCLAMANIIATVLSFRKALQSADIQGFLSVVITSMVARVVCMLAVLFFGIKVWHLHSLTFALTLVCLYLLSMSAEIVYIHREQLKKERERQHSQTQTKAAA